MAEQALISQDSNFDSIPEHRPTIDVSKALKLRLINKLSYQAIGDLLGVARQSVHIALKPFLGMIADPEAREAYQKNKANILESVQLTVVSKLTDTDKLEKASINNLAYAAGQLNQMIRLERGESTGNITYLDITAKERDLDRQLAELDRKLGRYGVDLEGYQEASDAEYTVSPEQEEAG